MRAFAELFEELDQTTSTNEKIHAMVKFFGAQDPETCAWALYFLTGRKPKQLIGSAKLRAWAQEITGIPTWLMEESLAAVGDTAEAISLMLGARTQASRPENNLTLGEWMDQRILPLRDVDDDEKKTRVTGWWADLSTTEIFILNKCLTGGLRVGVSETLVFRALEQFSGLPRSAIASRLLGTWQPSATFYERVIAPVSDDEQHAPQALPKPFCLAAPVEDDPKALGPVSDWQLEWKWDGIRCQAVKTHTELEIWSRGEERITESFPDLVADLSRVPGCWILDGEILAGTWQQPLPFQDLQKRLNRKKPSANFQKENPVCYYAYDLLQVEREDWSQRPLGERRDELTRFLSPHVTDELGISPAIEVSSWEEAAELRKESRAKGAEGLMIKKKSAPYEVGRKRGIWFKWKVDPLTVDAVLTSAQPGTGKRASLYTDYTFSIWRDNELVPIAKAYSGLTDAEIRSLDNWIRRHTTDRFGPVRSLKAERVFEIGFEGIAPSTRHKAGFALRFPRILRERTDKKPIDADRVETLAALVESLRSPFNRPLPEEHPTLPVIEPQDSAPKTRKKTTRKKSSTTSESQIAFSLGETSEKP